MSIVIPLVSMMLLSKLRSSVFGVIKIRFKTSCDDSLGKNNTENNISPLIQNKSTQIFQENDSVVTKFSPCSYLNSISTTDSNTREK